jgi:predicted transposase
MMRSKLIGSKEAIVNFQFVTINGRVEFEDVERILRIAYYYSKAVKAGIDLALKGVSLNDGIKELYNIIPYAFYAETAYKQALALVENKGVNKTNRSIQKGLKDDSS